MENLVGELAALGTALAFAFTSSFFTIAIREVGSPLINRTRLLVALILIMGLSWLTTGEFLPFSADSSTWGWLLLSGFIGLALGDASLFQAFHIIGPRISMLVMALAPVLSAIMAWIFLGEILTTQELLGILLTVGGIGWVVSERQNGKQQHEISGRTYAYGLLFAFGGALGQATGLLTSKLGLTGDISPISANAIRLLAAVAAIWLFTAFQRQTVSSFQRLRAYPRATMFMLLGSVAGPVVGVSLSLLAVQQAPSLGVASTLMALTPIFLLPIGYIVFNEHISRRAIIGTMLAFAGTALLFL